MYGMEKVITVIYKYKNQPEENLYPALLAEGEKANAAPGRFFLKQPGLYDMGGAIYRMDREGLYIFNFADGGSLRYCLYEKDLLAFMSAILRCCDFSGRTLPIDRIDILSLRFLTNNVEEIAPAEMLKVVFLGKNIPYRVINVYSAKREKSAFLWLEMWDEYERSWHLYWPDLRAYLGKTGPGRTCFDVLKQLGRGEVFYEPAAAGSNKPRHKMFAAGESYAVTHDILDKPETVAELIEKEQLLLLFGEKNNDVKLYTRPDSRRFFPDGQSTVKVDNFPFRMIFADDKTVRERFYGPQVHVLPSVIKRIK